MSEADLATPPAFGAPPLVLPAIDPDEPLVPLTKVPRQFGHLLPSSRSARATVAVPTVFRYATRGLRGVRLETVRSSAGICTSRSRVDRFISRLTGAETTKAAGSMPPPTCLDARRAELALDAAGL